MKYVILTIEFLQLPGSFVIFVCDFDPFGKGKYCYTFENRCLEELDLSLEDESRSFFLSTKGKNSKMIPEELLEFLKFVEKDTSSNDMKTENSYVKQVQRTIRSIKESREMECWYQFQGDMLYREYRRGKLESAKETIFELLEELGLVPDSMKERIMSEKDNDVLKEMLKIAAKAESLEQFEERISDL